jgi:hypothetical protein
VQCVSAFFELKTMASLKFFKALYIRLIARALLGT